MIDIEKLLHSYIIVIYDGDCGFCNESVQFILKQKPSKRLRFISFQSDLGVELRKKFAIGDEFDSIFVIEDGHCYKKSKAVFSVLKHTQGKWSFLRLFSMVPVKICDFFYDIIAKNRYRLKSNKCLLLKEDQRIFFL